MLAYKARKFQLIKSTGDCFSCWLRSQAWYEKLLLSASVHKIQNIKFATIIYIEYDKHIDWLH